MVAINSCSRFCPSFDKLSPMCSFIVVCICAILFFWLHSLLCDFEHTKLHKSQPIDFKSMRLDVTATLKRFLQYWCDLRARLCKSCTWSCGFGVAKVWMVTFFDLFTVTFHVLISFTFQVELHLDSFLWSVKHISKPSNKNLIYCSLSGLSLKMETKRRVSKYRKYLLILLEMSLWFYVSWKDSKNKHTFCKLQILPIHLVMEMSMGRHVWSAARLTTVTSCIIPVEREMNTTIKGQEVWCLLAGKSLKRECSQI